MNHYTQFWVQVNLCNGSILLQKTFIFFQPFHIIIQKSVTLPSVITSFWYDTHLSYWSPFCMVKRWLEGRQGVALSHSWPWHPSLGQSLMPLWDCKQERNNCIRYTTIIQHLSQYKTSKASPCSVNHWSSI